MESNPVLQTRPTQIGIYFEKAKFGFSRTEETNAGNWKSDARAKIALFNWPTVRAGLFEFWRKENQISRVHLK